jgi:DNA-binding transcriptional ArsR family regulator
MEDKVTLDREAFRVLASGTRVGILKSLKKQRKTLTELAREFGMSASAVKEHLDSLAGADLVIQKDDGHKWKYYELTRKGSDILNPDQTKVWVLLSASGIAALGVAYDMLQRFTEQAPMLMSRDVGEAMKITNEAVPAGAMPVAGLPWLHIGLLAASVALFGITLGYFMASRKRIV